MGNQHGIELIPGHRSRRYMQNTYSGLPTRESQREDNQGQQLGEVTHIRLSLRLLGMLVSSSAFGIIIIVHFTPGTYDSSDEHGYVEA